MGKQYYVYITSNKWRTVFYTGITSDLVRRVYEHKNKIIDGFTKKYNVNELLYFEQCNNPESAIMREKQIKDYRRGKKITLIKGFNPEFKDLYESLV